MNKSASNSTLSTTALTVVVTSGFYLAAPNLPGLREPVARYFGSEIGIVCTTMFFAGLSILLLKMARIRKEKHALRQLLDDVRDGILSEVNEDERHDSVSEWCENLPDRYHESYLFQRLSSTLQYLSSSGRRGVEDHLRYLAELASERLSQSYATIRTITWAIPILGFLGTVIGITLAISDLTPEQLDSSLADVTQGLGFAFDTTALALAMSIVLVFASFATERLEQSVLNDVEQIGIEYVLPWFSVMTDDAAETEQAGRGMAGQLDELRGVWTAVLQQHAEQLSTSMAEEVNRTLELHRKIAAGSRDAYARSLDDAAASVLKNTEHVLSTFANRIDTWQAAMRQSSVDATSQTEAIHDLGAILLRMSESEERLARLQQQLNENLQTLELADTMEQSANSLTAAVHVLTARASQRAA